MRRFLLCVVLSLLGCKREPPGPPPVRVAAAADLTAAFEAAGTAFSLERGQEVQFSFGSSGLLAKQLREGAPFDVFAAADAHFVDALIASGACDGATRAPYGRGRVVVWSKGTQAPPKHLEALQKDSSTRLAIANPEHAPYGRAAKEALERAGAWEAVAPRLVYAENVRQALQLAETGNVDLALVALSLVVEDREHPWVLVDEALHAPIDQVLVVCTRGGNRAGGVAFADFIGSERGQALMRRFGFVVRGDRQAVPW